MAYTEASLGSMYQSAVGSTLPPAAPLDEIAGALQSARELTARIRGLADKVLGPQPEVCAAGKNDGRESASGSLPRVQGIAADARDEISAANRACSRLEAALSA